MIFFPFLFRFTLAIHPFPFFSAQTGMLQIPQDWAMYQTYLAGELVHETFLSKVHRRPAKHMPIGQLDIDMCIALEHLADTMAAAYANPGTYSHII